MKFDITLDTNQHKDMVTSVTWTPNNELFTCSDDKTICKWSMEGECSGKVCDIDAYVTSLSWFPSLGRQQSDLFAVSCTDGSIRLISRTGREEKKIDQAHLGAVVQLKWNRDGSALVSVGEDGAVKVWSRSGNLRSTLLQLGRPVYAVCWGSDNDQILLGNGRDLLVKNVQAGKKQLSWPAHDGVVTCLDWNPVQDLIVSGGEDCTYRVWDAFGRQLKKSEPLGAVVTAVAWSPSGEHFAVGAFDHLRLCDKTGWAHSRDRPQGAGSFLALAWTADGTQCAGAGAGGAVAFAQIVEKSHQWRDIEAVLVTPKKIRVQDVAQESYEDLLFPRDRVVEMALGFGHLVVGTATQCYVYNTQNWNTPHIFDLKAAPSLVMLSPQHFALVDPINAVSLYTYEGRPLSAPRYQGLRPEFVNRLTMSVSRDTVALLDRTDCKTVRLFEVATGRAMNHVVTHGSEIVEVALNQHAPVMSERRLVFVDRNKDLWITGVVAGPGGQEPAKHKLHTQVDSVEWNDGSDMLAAIADGRLRTWFYPNVVFVDRDLLPLTVQEKDAAEFGPLPAITTFFGDRVTVRKADGTLLYSSAPPHPRALHGLAAAGRWADAARLCRHVQSRELWGCLAAMALHGNNLETAEAALAAVGEVHKLQYVLHIKHVPSVEGQNAELMLYRRQPDQAEAILLQAKPPLVYRAIKMNVRLFRWHRALELAVKHKSHVDTVLGYRQRHLQALGAAEDLPLFQQYAAEVQIDWEAIRAKKEQEREAEAQRGNGGGGYGGGK
ncbi:unnamed protein product [Heterosigma akashiwo]